MAKKIEKHALESKGNILRIKSDNIKSELKKKELEILRQDNWNKKISQRIKRCLDEVLHIEANTSSCAYIFQPKAPTELKKFKRKRRCKDEKKNCNLVD